MRFKQVRQKLADYQWFVIGGLWVIMLYLGSVGFAKNAQATGESFTPLDVFYRALQLIPMNSGGVVGPVSWELEIARLGVPALTVFAALKALAIVFRDQVQLLRLRLLGNHIVICGLSRKGLLLTTSLRERGDRVVVIERNEGNEFIEPCRERGAIVLIGDATNSTTLQKAGIRKARYIVALCNQDGVNVEIAMRAQELSARRGRNALTCVIHIVDPQLCELMRDREIFMGSAAPFRLELFNVFDRGARQMLRVYPAFDDTKSRVCPPHLLVVGLGRMGESVVVHTARRWWETRPSKDQRLRITAIDREANRKVESLRVRYPRLEQTCDLSPCQMDVHSPEFQRADFLYDSQHECHIDTIYICLDNDSLGLHTGLTLLRQLRDRKIPIVIRMTEDAGLATLLHKRHEDHTPDNLFAFGLLDRTCTPELLLGSHEVLARALHEEYVRQQGQQGQTSETSPALVPWDNLAEHFKESNRRQVDHIGIKLKRIGCGIAPLTDWDSVSFQFKSDEVELMAQMEHERWSEDLRLNGWRYAPGRKVGAKQTHQDLVSWEQLPESERDKNRSAVRELPRFLVRAGFEVYRLPSSLFMGATTG